MEAPPGAAGAAAPDEPEDGSFVDAPLGREGSTPPSADMGFSSASHANTDRHKAMPPSSLVPLSPLPLTDLLITFILVILHLQVVQFRARAPASDWRMS
jgi:hypothetical protein